MTHAEMDTLLLEMMTSLSKLIAIEYTEITRILSVLTPKRLIFQRFQRVSTLSTLFLYTPYIHAYIYIPP